MSDEFVGSKKHFKFYLIICSIITLPGFLFGLTGVCTTSYLLMIFYGVAGFPWNFAIVPLLEHLLEGIPSVYEKSEELCLGPLDVLSMSIPVYINVGLVFILFLFFFARKKKNNE